VRASFSEQILFGLGGLRYSDTPVISPTYTKFRRPQFYFDTINIYAILSQLPPPKIWLRFDEGSACN
jgi:hypothetical protein